MSRKHRGEKLEGIRSHGTDMGGDGYVHPRSEKYRENFDKIKWNKSCDRDDCCGGVVGCDECKCRD